VFESGKKFEAAVDCLIWSRTRLALHGADALRDHRLGLAGSPNGSTESIMLTHGFAIGTLHELVRNGLATGEQRTMRAGRRLINVTWMSITDAGRQALAE
jgi:hypothetical protein